ncbi:hypothetical protein QZH41_012269, partial [Actinostola sp. cb2023]
NSRDQKEEENIDRYVAELRTLAQGCGFCKCLNDSLIRDRIVRYKDVFEVHDDKVIYGVEETEEEATADHNKKLQQFLLRCKEKGMKLNKKNLKLKCKEITYLGHLITQNGLNPDPEKIEAVKKMPKFTNVKGAANTERCGLAMASRAQRSIRES